MIAHPHTTRYEAELREKQGVAANLIVPWRTRVPETQQQSNTPVQPANYRAVGVVAGRGLEFDLGNDGALQACGQWLQRSIQRCTWKSKPCFIEMRCISMYMQ